MQYIWEVVLAAEKNGIREADLRYEVLSGVNQGSNLGFDVAYSGTIC